MLSLLLATSTFASTSIERAFNDTISRVEAMVWDSTAQSLVRRHGLSLVNVTWEDTARSKGSVWGPNISDMTIGVRDPRGALHPMPVVRFDNYTDLTGDIDADDLRLRVGNSRGRSLWTVSLADLLQSPRSYLHDPYSWAGSRHSLWSSRDDAVIVSAQACFLPIPRSGEATFTPVIYNYQSYPGNPAVLTITATREGTSMQVIENGGGYLSEPLFFNDNGERAPFTATRLSDWAAEQGIVVPADSPDTGLDVVMVIQVPLKQRAQTRGYDLGADEMAAAPSAAPMGAAAKRSDVETAVVSHGQVEGPFTELNGLAVERDSRYPVRVTVQFYKATSSGQITDSDVRAIRSQIDAVYRDADAVSSLVVDGYTGRSTEWVAPSYPKQPVSPDSATWADPFWSWHKAN